LIKNNLPKTAHIQLVANLFPVFIEEKGWPQVDEFDFDDTQFRMA
jgi:hypothetical protein